MLQQTREDPLHEAIRFDRIRPGQPGFREVLGEFLVEEPFAEIERLRIGGRATNQVLFHLGARAQVQDQRMLAQYPHRFAVGQFADAAAGIVQKVVVAVDLVGLVDETLDISHGRGLGLEVQPLPSFELGEVEPTHVGTADLAEERRHGFEVVHADVVGDVDRIAAQEVAQEVHLHRLPLDVVEDRLGEVFGADAVVAGIVKPLGLRQLVREPRLADAGHSEQRHCLAGPGQELVSGH